jgi:predicted RND superfamily exporter protein
VSALSRLIARRPIAVLAIIGLLTVLAIAGIVDLRTGERRLRIDPNLIELRSGTDPGRQSYERARRLFGSDDSIVVALQMGDVFSPESLGRVAAITERLQALRGVQEVLSLSTAIDIWSVGEEVEIGPFLSEIPAEPQDLQRLRERVRANPIYGSWVVSPDGRSTAFLLTLREMSDQEYLESGLDVEIASVVREEAGTAEVWITGSPHIKVGVRDGLVRNLVRIVPWIILVLALVPVLAFRTLLGVVLPVLTVVLAVVWTLGIIAWLDRPLNVVTSIVPMLILTIGFAYAIHVVSAFYEAARTADPQSRDQRADAVYEGLQEVGLPVILTGLTTMAAFLSLMLSPVGAIRQFGWMSVVGVLCTLVASLTLIPPLLTLVPGSSGRKTLDLGRGLDRLAETLAPLNLEHRSGILLVGVVILILAAIGTTRIRTNTDFIENFPPDAGIRRDYEAINEEFGGVNPFYIVLETYVPDAFMEPANLRTLQSLQNWLEAQPEIGETISIVDYLMLLNRSLHEGDPAHFVIPENRRLAKQLFFFGATRETEALIDARYQIANLVGRTHLHDSAGTRALVERIQERLSELPTHLSGTVTGSIVLLGGTVDAISRGQILSLSAACLAIYAMLALIFSSFRVGFVALFPNILPIAVYFGLLGFSGITLNTTTSLVGCLALGIAVDDTIHYFARFNTDAKRAANERAATRSALRAVIRPVSYTTLALCSGFLMLLLSEFRRTGEFGALAAFTLGAAWLIDITLTPALCSGLRIVTLWDVLTLDLGREPHKSIPLLAGLSHRQARIVALMSKISEFRRGTRLFRKGEEGTEMYTIIDGTLVGSDVRDGHRLEVAKMSRGDIVGEVGLFAQRRSLDVEAESDCRLLCLTSEDLERLRRRNPRIAAQVYRNLNEIQAERLARLTERIR